MSAPVLLLAVLFVLAPSPARGDSMFLKIDGIDGQATAAGYVNQIQLLSWSWGVSNPVTVGSGTGGLTAGKVSMAEFAIMKSADSSTPRLLEYANSAKHAPKAVLSMIRSTDGFVYLKITLEDVMVSSLQLSAADERPSESVSLSFAKVGIEYWAGPGKPRVASGWDVVKNMPFTPGP
jgi:type VI secretion system secreted protein Hcp